MPRPTLITGSIWSDNLANSSGYPTHNGTDSFGDGPKIIDSWLDDAPDQIKARFYAWLNRIKITQGSGRAIAYTGATILLPNGTQTSLAPGTLTLPASSTVFVYVSDAGVLSQAPTLPTMCLPLAKATTDASAITTLNDLRYQAVEHVRPRVADGAASFEVGDIKASARATPSSGWVLCDQARYNDIDYPLAATAIGRAFSQAADPAGTFRVPDYRNRTLLGASTTRPIGTGGGAESVALTSANNGKHAHPVTEAEHAHPVTDQGHGHGVRETPHGHAALGKTFSGDGRTDSIIVNDAGFAGEDRGNYGYVINNNNGNGQRLIQESTTAVAVMPGQANIQVAATKTNIVIRDSGEGTPHENMMPFVAANIFIRLF